jgi:hypothetical protein
MYEAPRIDRIGSVSEFTSTPGGGNNSGGNHSGKGEHYYTDGHQYHNELTPGLS